MAIRKIDNYCPYPPTLQNPDYPAGSGKCIEDCEKCLKGETYGSTIKYQL